jgi:dihydroorotate dehydrogenase
MIIISLVTKILHYLPGELSHSIALRSLKFLNSSGIIRLLNISSIYDFTERDIRNRINMVGIAAGLDKNGDYIDCLASLGIGFIEVGTVTPKPQEGNPKPRISRNKKEKSLLNRLGFNNKGVDYLVEKLKKRQSEVILGSSIGKNFDTPNDKAYEDYIYCLEKVYEFSDYIAVNISSPNTKDLRKLGSKDFFDSLLKKLKDSHAELSKRFGYKPIFIKISPDETQENLALICKSILSNKMDGIICSNTTASHQEKFGPGGLSGAPLKIMSNQTLTFVRNEVGKDFPIIASGGVMSVEDYQEKLRIGADLVQIYTGFIYEGPKLIQDIVKFSSD